MCKTILITIYTKHGGNNFMLTPIKKTEKKVLYIQIADSIMEYIKDKKLVKGDKLPSERVLSESLKISRNSVREALRFLETQGVITVHTGIGSFIACDCSDRSVYLQFSQLNYQETLEIKITLEIMLASKIIDTITEEQLSNLDLLLTKMEEDGTNGIAFHETDLQFHRYLYNLSPNATLKNMISAMTDTLDNYWSISGDFPEDNNSLEFHRNIVRGLHNKDFELIRESYKNMWKYDIELFQKHIKRHS